MTERYRELQDLTRRFVDAFNNHDIDTIEQFFADDAVYEDTSGATHRGPAAIRKAFEPLVSGGRGQIRFDDEDYFAEPETGKVLASWTLNMEIDGQPAKMRGLDILQFSGDKLVRKLAYCKSAAPRID